MHVGQACEGFIRFCEVVRKLSPHTIRAYRLDLKRFASFMGIQSSIGECSRTTLHAYVEQLFSVHSLKAASAKRHLASLRSMFRWLEAEGEIPEDPFQRTRINIRMPKRLPRVLSRQDLSLLLHQQPDGDFNDLTAYVAVELLFATGVRIAELAGESRTLVFFEAPHRIAESLEDLAAGFGVSRRAAVARELTKVFETVYRGTLGELEKQARSDSNFTRGEITVVIEGAPRADADAARLPVIAASCTRS
jgi:integrase